MSVTGSNGEGVLILSDVFAVSETRGDSIVELDERGRCLGSFHMKALLWTALPPLAASLSIRWILLQKWREKDWQLLNRKHNGAQLGERTKRVPHPLYEHGLHTSESTSSWGRHLLKWHLRKWHARASHCIRW